MNAAAKQLYALTTFISENALSTQLFVENFEGVEVLTRYLSERTSDETIPLKVSLSGLISLILSLNLCGYYRRLCSICQLQLL